MSRIGKQPIALPDKVKVTIEGARIVAEGPAGRLERTIASGIVCEKDEANRRLVLRRTSDDKQTRMMHGLERALVRNMVQGVAQGYRKELEVVGIGYTVKLEGKFLVMDLGFANPVKMEIPAGIKVEIAQATNPGKLSIFGPDKYAVGQFAALVRSKRPPEPYQGKGIKYANEIIRRKAGKAFVGTGA